ncbi:phosphoethanolamine--lipid A transferase [Gammaproteobacteria bacterium AS21]
MKTIKLTPISLASNYFNLLLSIVLACFYNQRLWSLLFSNNDQPIIVKSLFIISFFTFLVAIFNLILTVISVKLLHKPLAVAIILSAAIATYFINTFGIVYDKTMIQNTFETDIDEVADLFNAKLIIYIILLGVIPSMIIIHSKITYSPLLIECKKKIIISAVCLVIIIANLAVFYKDYSSTFRNQREIRNVIIPSSYIYYAARYMSGAYEQQDVEFQTIAEDARLAGTWQKQDKKVVTILVVGETARAKNFALNGYARNTNPNLSQQDIVNFSNVSSCGTSTAVSVPCLFSKQARVNFDGWQAENSENVLDVMRRIGFDVMWRDNNSGCKGVCDRITKQGEEIFANTDVCQDKTCFDEAMLTKLDSYLNSNDKPALIVLHQQGSHGPAYSKRYPKAFAVYTPVCESSDLSSCTEQSIVNSYDNSILYTDYFLSKTIDYLNSKQDQYDTAMLYISDHGESLGENNIYLHGLPYTIAPDNQKEVPFMLWLSASFTQRFAINQQCLENKSSQQFSHDNIFHSLLGLYNVATTAYQAELDIFADCRQSSTIAEL